jgi:hypothetical protein
LASERITAAKRGPVASVDNQPVMHKASKRKAPPSEILQVKKVRANYSSGEALNKLTTAVNKWNAIYCREGNSERGSISDCSIHVSIRCKL